MTPFEAVAHPRVFCLHTDIIDVEARIPFYVCEELESRGNIVVRVPVSYGGFASPKAIVVDRGGNKVLGGSDPRNKGTVLST